MIGSSKQLLVMYV